MERFTAYCDLPFLDAFARLRPDGAPGDSDAVDRWAAVNAFLRRAAHVVVCADAAVEQDAAALAALAVRHPLLRSLLDRPDGPSLRFDAKPFEWAETPEHHANAPHPWRVYFVEYTHAPHADLSARLGALFADAQGAVEAWARLGTAHVVGIGTSDPGRLKAWSDLDGRWAPARDVVVADRYLFANADLARQNLIPLLLSLLPLAAEVPPSVLLVAREKEATAFAGDAERARRWVEAELRRARPGLDIHLSVALLDGHGDAHAGLHDRRLFLRYGFVESGASFGNCFRDGQPAATTRLTFSPLADPAVLARTVAELRALSQGIRSAARRGSTAVAGPPDHPLVPR